MAKEVRIEKKQNAFTSRGNGEIIPNKPTVNFERQTWDGFEKFSFSFFSIFIIILNPKKKVHKTEWNQLQSFVYAMSWTNTKYWKQVHISPFLTSLHWPPVQDWFWNLTNYFQSPPQPCTIVYQSFPLTSGALLLPVTPLAATCNMLWLPTLNQKMSGLSQSTPRSSSFLR